MNKCIYFHRLKKNKKILLIEIKILKTCIYYGKEREQVLKNIPFD